MQPTIEDFVATRGDALVRFALMLCGDHAGAEDLTQSVLARALPRWSRIAAMDRIEAYMKKMIVNEYLRWRRRRWHGEVPVADPTLAAASAHPAWADVAAAGGGLPSDGEIAAVLGCRTSTVRSNAARGLATLRAVLPTLERETQP